MMYKYVTKTVYVLTVLSIFSLTAYGYPHRATTSGNSCKSCHGGASLPGKMVLLNDGSMLDADESGTGATDRGLIKVYDVLPGESVTLSMQVLNGDEKYAIQIKRFEKTGVVSGSTLVYTEDPTWVKQTAAGSPPYYTMPIPQFIGLEWSAQSQKIFDFELTIDASTPVDVYNLEFATAGKDLDGMWYADEHFYVNVIPEPASVAIVSCTFGMLMFKRRR